MPDAAGAPDRDAALLDRLTGIVGEDGVLTGDADRAFYSQDLYEAGAVPLAVIRPQDTETLRQTVRVVTEAGLPIYPRGGGLSYTNAFLPQTSRAILLDLGRMDRILDLDETDCWVRVEAGCSWAALEERLSKTDLRPAFWGPMSGAKATIGGGMSQGSLSLGSAKHGPSGGVALSFGIVTANGELIETGSAGQDRHSPFFRQYGPDLTGIFTADAGALGIKATVTLALSKRPGAVGGVSFAFDGFPAFQAACARIARDGLATEVIGMDRALMQVALGKQDMRGDAQAALAVAKSAPGPLTALQRLTKMALAGRDFLTRADWSGHFVAEAPDAKRLSLALEDIRRAVGGDGMEIANTLPTVLRANPFPPPDVMGQEGRRLLAMHGILPMSQTVAAHDAVTAFIASQSAAMQQHGVLFGLTTTTVGANAFLYEPVIYWPDALEEFHRRVVPEAIRKTMPRHPDNPAGRALVRSLQQAIIEILYEHGAVHVQIGRAYPYLRDRNPASVALLRQIKQQIDPDNLINPGALGLD